MRHSLLRLGSTALVLLVLHRSSSAHDVLLEVRSQGIPGFGRSAIGLDDVDGDGVRDFAVNPDAGGLGIRSGATGALILSIAVLGDRDLAPAGDLDGDGVGELIVSAFAYSPVTGALIASINGLAGAGVGDVDGDLVPDLVGADRGTGGFGGCDHYTTWCSGAGYAELVSVGTGAVLHRWDSPAACDAFGGRVVPAGDVDGDGASDVCVLAMWELPIGWAPTRVYSSATGAELLVLPEIGPTRPLGDIDGDGRGDLAVASRSQPVVRARSGLDGSLLWASPVPSWAVGSYNLTRDDVDLHDAGDVDGDGTVDLIVSVPQPTSGCGPGGLQPFGTGCALLLSGADGVLLHTFVGHAWGSEFSRAAAGLGDLDGDGTPEILLGAPLEPADNGGTGVVRIYSGAAGYTAPQVYCDGTQFGPTAGAIAFAGSPSAASGAFALTFAGAAPSAVGVLLFGSHPAAGRLSTYPATIACIAPPVQFLRTPVLTDASGSALLPLALGAPTSPFAIGTTWHFQLAWRAGGQAGRSDAIALTVLP